MLSSRSRLMQIRMCYPEPLNSSNMAVRTSTSRSTVAITRWHLAAILETLRITAAMLTLLVRPTITSLSIESRACSEVQEASRSLLKVGTGKTRRLMMVSTILRRSMISQGNPFDSLTKSLAPSLNLSYPSSSNNKTQERCLKSRQPSNSSQLRLINQLARSHHLTNSPTQFQLVKLPMHQQLHLHLHLRRLKMCPTLQIFSKSRKRAKLSMQMECP